MADPTGFLTTPRQLPARRPVDVRIRDWHEVYEDFSPAALRDQAGRCMDCGIAFCHRGCPLGNLIPEWNDLYWRDDLPEAMERLHATNNFPEFTGRLCPAPCEPACVLGISDQPVAIKQVELGIVEQAWDRGLIPALPAPAQTGRRVAVVGSGPAGLAAAQQLTRAGHSVTVFERADRLGGLLRYGIPEFKMEKRYLDRRLDQMRAEGTRFRTGVDVGVDVTGADLRREFDAVVLACGAPVPRDLAVPGRDLAGIHFAMEYLPLANRVQQGDLAASPIDAAGRRVVIIGGGDTGADCLGTAHRQGALEVTQLEILPRPPHQRAESTPWPTYPLMLRSSSAHEEGGERFFSVTTRSFLGEAGRVTGLLLADVVPVAGGFEEVEGSERVLPADLVLLAMGFVGAEPGPLLDGLGAGLAERGTVARDQGWAAGDGVFVAGDMGRGQSLIVWAIAEGRAAAAAVDRYLMGSTDLPAPIQPTDRPL